MTFYNDILQAFSDICARDIQPQYMYLSPERLSDFVLNTDPFAWDYNTQGDPIALQGGSPIGYFLGMEILLDSRIAHDPGFVIHPNPIINICAPGNHDWVDSRCESCGIRRENLNNSKNPPVS